MNVLTYNPDGMTKSTVIPLGRACECRATRIDFTVASWLARFPGGSIVLYIKDPNGETYLAAVTVADGVASWVIKSTDTTTPGFGSLELALVGVNGEKKLSAVATTKLDTSLVESEPDGDHAQPWLERAAEIQAETEDAARAAAVHSAGAYDSADAAAKARAAAEAAADAAEASEAAAAASATEAAAGKEAAAASEAAAAASATEAAQQAADAATAANEAYNRHLAANDAASEAARLAYEAGQSASKASISESNAAASAEAARAAAAEALAAPAINQEASAALVVIKDAAARHAVSLVSHIAHVQAGTGNPSPDNIRAISGWDAVRLYHAETHDATTAPVLTAALPETVYGGTLDWLTGVLTIDRMLLTFDGTENWGKNNTVNNTVRLKTPDGAAAVAACTHYICRSITPSGNDLSVVIGTQLNIRDSVNAVDVATWKAYLAAQVAAGTPVSIICVRESPIVHQLDPQQLDMLKGENALWSDTGDTALIYTADTKLYIDNAMAAMVAAVLNV